MAKVTYIDPPAGWKYGFPKIIPKEHQERASLWLVEQGYPKEILEEYGEHFYVRMWEQEENVDEQRL